MARLARKSTGRDIKDAAKAAAWIQKKMGGATAWMPNRGMSGTVYSPFKTKSDFAELMKVINDKSYGKAVTLKENVMSRYSPVFTSLGSNTIGGGDAPGASAILHELGHHWTRGPKWVQQPVVSMIPKVPVRYAQGLADILPHRIPGAGLLKYVERSPLLIEEARASLNAMKALEATGAAPSTKRNIGKAMAGAFGTYINPLQ